MQVSRGDVISDTKNDPAREAAEFTAQLVIISHPGQISVGYTPVVDAHTTHVACTFAQLVAKVDRRTGKPTEENPPFVKAGDTCVVRLVPTRAMCVEPFAEYSSLARIAVRDMKSVVAVGVIKSVEKKEGGKPKGKK